MPRELLRKMDKMSYNMKEEEEMRKGPWSEEEDLVLINYIENHGDGRWNTLARSSELKRTGKSCRLRWLNYLCPNVRRGNITPEEQLLILDLHSRLGNKWSKIARHLPGRTDNEIKNYWRTKVQKHAKQLKCDVNSTKFKDIVRHIWIPRLLERIQACSNSYPTQLADNSILPVNLNDQFGTQNLGLDNTSTTTSSNSFETRLFVSPSSQFSSGDSIQQAQLGNGGSAFEQSLSGSADHGLFDPEQWEMGENSWNVDDIWF